MPGVVKQGDVWDALEKAQIRPSGAGLGTAFFHAPDKFQLPNRKFADDQSAPSTLLTQLAGWGVHPVASGKYGALDTARKEPARVALLEMADWSDPGTTVIAGVNAIAFYLGGWTPHVWVASQIAAQTVAEMLPIWVYNPGRPGSVNGTTDGNAAVAALRALGIPRGVRCALDLEGSVDAAYVSSFRGVIAAAGYYTTLYGSASSLFNNYSLASGPGGGWWVADWTGVPHLYNHAGVWATQYANGGTGFSTSSGKPWDLSMVSVLDHLWPHLPALFSLTASTQSLGGSSSKSASFTLS